MPIDINALTDEEIAKSATLAPAAAPSAGGGVIDISSLSDSAVQEATGGSAGPSLLESFGRGAAGGATFEFGDEIGLLDREKQNISKRANPWTHFAGSMVGGLAPTLALGPLGLAARLGTAGRYLAGALVPSRSASVLGAAGQGAKVGTTYGAITGAGATESAPDATMGESFVDRLKGAGVGAAEGLVLGGGLGAAGHGVGKAFGAAADRMLPGLSEGRQFARDPANQGVRDILKDARRDLVDFDATYRQMTPVAKTGGGGKNLSQPDVDRIIDMHSRGASPGDIAAEIGRTPATVNNWIKRYQSEVGRDFDGQNLLEALKTPTRPGQIKTTKNLDDLADYAARTPGEGANKTQAAMLQRKADQPSVIADEVDRMFGTGDIRAYRDKVSSEGTVAFNKLYGDMHNPANVAPWPTMAHLPERLTTDPMFHRALKGAQRLASVEGKIPPPQTATQTFASTFSPAVIDYMQRILRKTAEGTGANAEIAKTMRSQFLSHVDNHLKGFPQVRAMYRAHKARLEMLDAGEKFNLHAPIKPGSANAEALAEFRKWQGIANAKGSKPEEKAMAKAITEDFKKGVGQSVKQMFDSKNSLEGGVAGPLNNLQAKNVKERLTEILGKKEAEEFVAMLARERRKIVTGQTLYGNSKTQARGEKSRSMEAVADIASGIATLRPGKIARGAGDLFTDKLREARGDRINESLAPYDMNTVRQQIMLLREMNRGHAAADRYFGNPLRKATAPITGAAVSAVETPEETREPFRVKVYK
jgi:transposase-like protein